MKMAAQTLLFAAILALGMTGTASAQTCSASLNCNNACSLDYICPDPYPPCELFCSASSQTISCTGTSTCSVNAVAKTVTCDGVTKTCPTASQCRQFTYSIRCGSTTKNCTYNCPL